MEAPSFAQIGKPWISRSLPAARTTCQSDHGLPLQLLCRHSDTLRIWEFNVTKNTGIAACKSILYKIRTSASPTKPEPGSDFVLIPILRGQYRLRHRSRLCVAMTKPASFIRCSEKGKATKPLVREVPQLVCGIFSLGVSR